MDPVTAILGITTIGSFAWALVERGRAKKAKLVADDDVAFLRRRNDVIRAQSRELILENVALRDQLAKHEPKKPAPRKRAKRAAGK